MWHMAELGGHLHPQMAQLGLLTLPCRMELHFVRCIKPNGLQVATTFDAQLTLHQLRCCGVLEVTRIARAGYPTRYLHNQFAERYHVLLHGAGAGEEHRLIALLGTDLLSKIDTWQLSTETLVHMEAIRGSTGHALLYKGIAVYQLWVCMWQLRADLFLPPMFARCYTACSTFVTLSKELCCASIICGQLLCVCSFWSVNFHLMRSGASIAI